MSASRLRAYAGLARMQVRTMLVYRSDYVFGLLGVLLQVLLLRVVWTAVYAAAGTTNVVGTSVGPVTLSTQIAYATLASLQYWLLSPWSFTNVPQRIRSGAIAIDLLRPVKFLQQNLATQVGATLAMAPFAVCALPLAVLLGGAEPPASTPAGLWYAVSVILAYLLATLLNTVTGLVAFWTLETQGIFMIYRMVAQFFAGALVPLWFMPGLLRTISEYLPFQATTYVPLGIYLGRITGADLVTALATQAFWVVAVWFLMYAIWSRALRRIIVQGG